MGSGKGTTALVETLNVDGLSVIVTRKRVRNINLRVQRDGTVSVSAPKRVPASEIERFVRSKYAWIQRARQRLAHQEDRMSLACTPGAHVFLWGRELTCTLDGDSGRPRKTWGFEVSGDRLIVRPGIRMAGEAPSYEEGSSRLSAWLRRQLSQRVQEALPHWQQVVGKECSAIRLRAMSSRWGSCNLKTGVVTLSTHLVHFDPRCLDYVICHELCHLHEPSHNARFHALMDQFYPGWQDVRAELSGR